MDLTFFSRSSEILNIEKFVANPQIPQLLLLLFIQIFSYFHWFYIYWCNILILFFSICSFILFYWFTFFILFYGSKSDCFNWYLYFHIFNPGIYHLGEIVNQKEDPLLSESKRKQRKIGGGRYSCDKCEYAVTTS